MKKLELPEKGRMPGLFLFCNQENCKKTYKSDAAVNCKCDKLVYKYIVPIPGSGGKSRTKNLEADNLDDALIECRLFKKELINNSFQKIAINEKQQTPVLLMDCIAAYIDFLNNVDVAFQNRKERAPDTIKEYERYLEYFLYSLKENGIDASILKFSDITEKMVGYACQYGLETRDMSAKTYNKYLSLLDSFTRKTIKKYKINCTNYFEDVQRLKVFPKKKSFNKKELLNLLELVKPENRIKITKSGKKRDLYRPWLTDAYLLGLLTGGRREEVAELKWNGIQYNENGDISYIGVNHFKINRTNSHLLKKGDYAVRKFSMNEDLFYLLIKLGYDKYKGTDRYILAPEEQMSRKSMMNFITDSFTHYYTLLGTGAFKTFKHLRKTYITALFIKHGDKTHEVTDHEDMGTLHKYYIDFDAVSEARRQEAKKYGRLF